MMATTIRQTKRLETTSHPDRFVVGTDPVWNVTRTQTWDQADDGWDHFEKLLDYHKRWLAQLPDDVRRALSVDNARRLFSKPAR